MVIIEYPNGDRYDGNVDGDNKHGYGTLTYADGGMYVGEWEDNLRNGTGTNTWANGNEYEGEWKDNKKHGEGTFTYGAGGSYTGNWKNDMRDGKGKNIWPDGATYEGSWRRNRRHGFGKLFYPNDGFYKGEWANDKRCGQGTNKWPNGDKYEGKWLNNLKHGEGVFYRADGTKQDGNWDSDNWVEPKKNPKFSGCAISRLTREFLQSLNWTQNIYDPKNNRCYCSECYLPNWNDIVDAGGAEYVIPRGFYRFGLLVDTVFSQSHQIWEKWIVTFHGTTKIAAISVIINRQFCLPGDKLIDGSILGIRDGHIPNQKYIFTSPTIAYSSSPAYSPAYKFTSNQDNKKYEAQIVLQCRQKPKSFRVQGETIGAKNQRICPFVSNERIEYFTDIRSSIVAYGLLIRVREANN